MVLESFYLRASPSLLQPSERIGCGEAGAQELKEHPFFRTIDWQALEEKKIKPPFKPQTTNITDVQNVDPEFLAEPPEETPVDSSELLKRSEMDGEFDNFTYVNEQNLSMVGSEAGRAESGFDPNSTVNN